MLSSEKTFLVGDDESYLQVSWETRVFSKHALFITEDELVTIF